MVEIPRLLGVRLFGSTARGDSDRLSDVDILAIVRNNAGKVADSEVARHLPSGMSGATISWYGVNRLKRMFQAGELFAWHLFLESKSLFDFDRTFESFDRPSDYMEATADILAFEQTLRDIPRQLEICPRNAVYELGVMYVCVRNVAMAASWHLCERPDFSRMSPYRLGSRVPPCPLSIEDYERSMICRMSSQRGQPPSSEVTADFVLSFQSVVGPWMSIVEQKIREIENGK